MKIEGLGNLVIYEDNKVIYVSNKNKIHTKGMGSINFPGYYSDILVYFSESKQMELITGSKT